MKTPTTTGDIRYSLACRRNGGNRGAALVIVLAFMVMLVGVVVAFFVKASSDRQVADSSASQTSAELFARGAMDTIIGDLRQEIADGSTATTVVTGTVTNIIYTPVVNSNAVPAPVGSSGTNGLQNLVKISTNLPFYTRLGPGGTTVTGTNRASGISTTNASLNYRSISASRWNRPLFITPTSATDYTPSVTFPVPSWVYVDRSGSNPPAWTNSLKFSPTNPSSVVGRYAYAIYDEGGLLDINVAGFPSTLASATNAYATNQLRYRGFTSFADLNQLTNSSGQLLSQAQINQLVSWRNSATLGTTNVPPAATNTTNFVNYVFSSPGGFVSTGNSSLLAGRSDLMFAGRQQLINYVTRQLGGSTNANILQSLQYFSTFTRSLNQPSIDPSLDTNYVQWDTGTGPWFYNYAGGNNAFGFDTNINGIFLTNRVASGSTWTRNDGTKAIVGEPLVQKRFPLDRLAWITSKGPICDGTFSGVATNATQLHTDAYIRVIAQQLNTTYGLSYSFLQQGTAANIRNYFGLVWSSGTTPSWAGLLAPNFWYYAPGAYGSTLATNPTAGAIANLKDITNREPNFIELLKSTIHVGGLSKSIGNVSGTYAYTGGAQAVRNFITIRDFSIDQQIMQTAVNIIEQASLDGYPKRIIFDNGGGTGPRLYSGIEDLPYFYRLKCIAVCANKPIPIGTGYNPTNNQYGTYTNRVGTVTNNGAISFLIIPEIWNPHDMNSRISSALRPSSLRLVADNTDPITAYLGVPPSLTANTTLTVGILGSTNPAPTATRFVLNSTNSELLFNDNGGLLFREPTALRNPGLPTNSSLTTGAGHMIRTDTNAFLGGVGSSGYLSDYRMTDSSIPATSSTNQFVGIYMGTVPIIRQTNISGTNYVTNIMTVSTIYHNEPQLTIRIQCRDLFGNWVDYDVKGWARIASGQSWSYGAAQVFGTAFYAYLAGVNGMIGTADVVDPRTSRWGMRACYPNIGNFYQNLGPQGSTWAPVSTNLTASNNVFGTHRPLFNAINNTNSGNPTGPSLNNPYPPADTANWTTGSDDGLLSVNLTNYGTGISSYRDPDGLTRGGMSAYTPFTGANPSSDIGLPLSTATTNWNTGTPAATTNSQNRPMILHRPFATVAELGHVFSDSVWKNIDFFTPGSAYTGLLDVFCIHETPPDQVLVAGKVNLNTRQVPVLQSILSGAYRDALNRGSSLALTPAEASSIAAALVRRTTTNAVGFGPLVNIGDLVGSYSQSSGGYTGFSSDLSGIIGSATSANGVIQRYREAAVRPLADCGQTRVWNLMIDLVAQTGRFPNSATSLSNFLVEGEQRYWFHVAIDRVTGQVIDSQIEQVRE